MSSTAQETEAKFYVRDLGVIQARLLALGARLLHPRAYELNLRFDLPDGSLRAAGRVLRLRRGDDVRLTYKGPSENLEGALSRPEIEVTVGDFETARQILEALGYRLAATYEKYRTTYQLQTSEVPQDFGSLVHVMLDELPYGNFVEIEGPDVKTLQRIAGDLGLDFAAAIPASYLALFERLCENLHLDPTLLTFETLNEIEPSAEMLRVRAADGQNDQRG